MNRSKLWILLCAFGSSCANCAETTSPGVGNDAGGAGTRDATISSPDTGGSASPDSGTPDAGPACAAPTTACVTETGTTCCPAAEACLFGGCVQVGEPCDESADCPADAYCEPTVQHCVDFSSSPDACIFRPPVGEFSPVEAFAWTGSTVSPEFDQVMMAPMIANLTDDDADGDVDADDTPDIVFVTFQGNGYNSPGILRVISGADGSEHWSSSATATPFDVRGGATPALGDIDGDGVVEVIIAGGTDSGVYAIEHDGLVKWHQPAANGNGAGGPAIANLDGAGSPEIITGGQVLNADGEIVCTGLSSNATPMVADLDQDGTPEILMGGNVYRLVDGSVTDGSGCETVRGGPSSLAAIADFDLDGDPEVVHARGGDLALHDHEGNEVWNVTIPIDTQRLASDHGIPDCGAPPTGQACTTNEECGGAPARCVGTSCVLSGLCLPGGGPPTVADFDGDGFPEIGIAARWYYLVYEADGSILWAHKTKDFSSAATGSSVFDFEGDGSAEVVYNDELHLRVYSGAGAGVDADGDGFGDPQILLEIENSSGTLVEYPLIVDVDNDGNAEIVVAANDYAFGNTKGVRVFKDAQNRWVGTRPIWNQHAYSVTNVEDDGTIPLVAADNWTEPRLNNFRQNVQGGNPHAAPNLTVTLDEVRAASCTTAGVGIEFTVRNEGLLGLRAGQLDVTVYAGPQGQPLSAIATLQNLSPLPPGGSETFTHTWEPPETLAGGRFDVRIVVDDDGNGAGKHNECVETDNEASQPGSLCQVPQ